MAHRFFLFLFQFLVGVACAAAVPEQGGAQTPPPSAWGGSLLELPGMQAAPTVPQAPQTAAPQNNPAPAPSAPMQAVPVNPLSYATPGALTHAVLPPAAAPALQAAPSLPSAAPVPEAVTLQARQQLAKAAAEVAGKNPTILLGPMHVEENVSLMFTKSDMKVITEGLAVYDKSAHAQKSDSGGNKDDLTSLLNAIKSQSAPDTAPAEAPPPPPNLYLGSIVYYSPGNWSVWINGKKLTNGTNKPAHEFYVTRLSREEIELVWKPALMLDTAAVWKNMTDNGAHPLARVSVNEQAGKITVQLHTNQTFLPRTLAIREGLIKSSVIASGVPPADNPAAPSDAVPSRPLYRDHP